MATVAKIAKETWYRDPVARLSMMRIKKNFHDLMTVEYSPPLIQKHEKFGKMISTTTASGSLPESTSGNASSSCNQGYHNKNTFSS